MDQIRRHGRGATTTASSSSLITALVMFVVALLMSPLVVSNFVDAQASVLCPTKAFDIRFQPIEVEPRSFFTQAGQTAVVTRSKVFPRIIVRAVDSNYNLDPTVQNVQIVVTSNDPTTTIDGTTSSVRMYDGEAHFSNLTILNGDLMKLNFTAVSDQLQRRLETGIERYRLPLHLKYIETGLVKVERQLVEQFALQFLATSSHVRYPNLPLKVVNGIELPSIRLQVVTSAYTQYRPLLGLANNFSVYVGFSGPVQAGTSISGILQPIVSGFATFDSLVITTTEKTLPGLIFTLTDPPLTVKTGPITVDILRDNAHIAFDDEGISHIYTQGQDFSGKVGQPFPKIQISVRDNMYRPSASARSGLIITASCGRTTNMVGTVAGVVSGIATFENLAFFGLNHQDFRPYVITFTAGTQQGFSGESIYTGVVMMSTGVQAAYRFRFLPGAADAFFNGQFQRKQVVKDNILTPPLRIELLNSDNTRDTVTQGLSVAIAVENGRFSSSSSVLQFKEGVAQSLDFRFTQTSTITNAYIVMSVTNTTDSSSRIVTGRVNVTNAVSNFGMRFQPYGASLFSNVGQPSFATIGSPLPGIVVELITSANTLDTGSQEITITATASGATLTGSFVRVANGVAVFRDLTFVSDIPGDFKITFTAGDAGSYPVQGKTLVTSTVTLFAAVTPNVRPRFTNNSFIQFAGQSRPVTLDIWIPTIEVELATSDHSPAQVVNGTAAMIVAELILSNGNFKSGTQTANIPVNDGIVTLSRLRVETGLDPVISICFRSLVNSGDIPPADGHCIQTGPLRTYPAPPQDIGYLNVYKNHPLAMTTLPENNKVAKGQVFQIAIAVYDTAGTLSVGRVKTDFEVEATTSVTLGGTSRVVYNKSTGLAFFDNLVFNSKDLGAGVTPSITFTAQASLSSSTTPAALLNVLPISTALLTIQGANPNSGSDVVAEILTDTLSFDANTWIDAAARRLNVESQRILQLRVFRGKSADPSKSGITEDATARLPSWSGTRFDMRFLPPLATSRDTRTAADLANLFVNLRPSCKIGELKLRKAYFNSTDQSCDWFIFDAQLTSVRSCVQSKGRPGFCGCHVPLFAFMGMRCLGLPRLTTLCLSVLINEQAANCPQKEIVDVCKLLQFPDAPRVGVMASGAVMFLCFIPLFYLYSGGFFHKISMPTPEQSRITKAMFVASDEQDLL